MAEVEQVTDKPLWPAVKKTFKKNIVPGLILFAIGLTVLICFFTIDSMNKACLAYSDWYNAKHVLLQQFSTAFFAGFFPYTIDFVRRYRAAVKKGNGVRAAVGAGLWDDLSLKGFACNVTFMTVFWYIKGIDVSYFYKIQSLMFGDGTSPGVLIPKVLFDQLVYNPFYGIWTIGYPFSWKTNEYNLTKAWAHVKSRHFYRFEQPMLLVSIWIVWFPMVTLVYSLPQPLQVPFWNLAMVFSSLIFFTLVNDNQDNANNDEDVELIMIVPHEQSNKPAETTMVAAENEINIAELDESEVRAETPPTVHDDDGVAEMLAVL
jgi:hypothetical protein